MTVINYPENFQDIIVFTIRLDDSFGRLNDLKKTNLIKYPNKKKERDSNVINW
jgi:hypothetical protein